MSNIIGGEIDKLKDKRK